MEFGKVDRALLSQIDLSLPVDDVRTRTALQTSRELHLRPDLHQSQRKLPILKARIGVGAPVWSVKEWVGKVYPIGANSKDFLSLYSRQFNSIELNSTHYGIPNEDTVTRWRESTPNGFKFNVKFFQNISHHHALNENERLTHEFVSAVLGLEDRLGLSFLQMPPHFSLDDLPRLKSFLKQIPAQMPLAVEVRHPSFFKDHALVSPLYETLQDAGSHVVITDVAGRRDVLHTSLPGPRVIVRFIGNGLDEVDEPRLDEWAERLDRWIRLGLEQVEFFIHEPEDKLVPDVAGRFIDRLNRIHPELAVPRWSAVKPAASQLKFF